MIASEHLRFILAGLFLVSFSISLLSASGRAYSGDGGQNFYTAKRILLGKLAIDGPGQDNGALKGRNGNYYSKYPPGMVGAMMPFLLVLGGAAAAVGMDGASKEAMLRDWVPILTNVTATALIAVLLVFVVLDMGYRLRVALATAAIVVFTTPVWPYAKYDLSEPFQALFLLVLFWMVVRSKPPVSLRLFVLAGIALGALMLVKLPYVLVAPAAFLTLCWKQWTDTPRAFFAAAFSFGAPVAAAIALSLVWNMVRFGSLFAFGYTEPFDTPVLVGLHGWFFSSGKSVFLYAPVLILVLLAIPAFWRRHRVEALAIAGITVPVTVLSAMFWSWHGDWAWATRYAVPLIPLWALPMATILAQWRPAHRVAVAAFVMAGLWVQILGVSINPAHYLSVHTFQLTPKIHNRQPDMNQSGLDVHFIPEFSPLAGHWWLLKAAIEFKLSPGKPYAQYRWLHNYPWAGRGERIHWVPDHPEHAAILDFWAIEPPPYMSRSAANMLAAVLLACLAAGIGLLCVGLRRISRDRREPIARGALA